MRGHSSSKLCVFCGLGFLLRLFPFCSACLPCFHRVDNLSKYFSALKEQEKRFKVMEAQVSNIFIGIYNSFRISPCFSNLMVVWQTPFRDKGKEKWICIMISLSLLFSLWWYMYVKKHFWPPGERRRGNTAFLALFTSLLEKRLVPSLRMLLEGMLHLPLSILFLCPTFSFFKTDNFENTHILSDLI